MPSSPDEPSGLKLGVYLSRKELGGESGSIAELTGKLAGIGRADVIKWVTWLLLHFGQRHRHSLNEQFAIAQQILPTDLLEAVRTRWQDPHEKEEVLFHRQQLWLVLQLACISCRNQSHTEEEAKDLLRQFGECLLLANDVLYRKVDVLEESAVPSLDWILATFLPLLEINWHGVGPAFPARAYSIWCECIHDPDIARLTEKLFSGESLDSLFDQAYGVSLTAFLDVIVTLHFLFQSQNKQKKHRKISRDDLCKHFSNREVDAAMALISRTPDSLADELLLTPRQPWSVDFLPLRRFPLIELFPGSYVCPDLQLLDAYFDEPLYWRVVEAVPRLRNEMQQLYGALFEKHLHSVLDEFLYSGNILAKQLYRQPYFVSDKTEAADAIIECASMVALIEIKATHFSRHQKYSGDKDAIMRAIDDAFAKDDNKSRKGIGQLAMSITRILNGEAISEPSSNGAQLLIGDRLIQPILAISESAIAIDHVRKHLDERLVQSLIKRGANTSRVRPLILLSHYHVEVLEAFCKSNSVEQLLREYSEFMATGVAAPLHSFSEYAAVKYGLVYTDQPTYMQKKRTEQLEQLTGRLKTPKL